MPNLLIAGCGFVGGALAQRASTLLGPDWQLWGLRRDAAALPPSVRPIGADVTGPTEDLARALPPVPLHAVVMCVAAKQSSLEAYARVYVHGSANLRMALQARGQAPQRCVFTSSTAVYPQERGEWVDEATDLGPLDQAAFRGNQMRVAEAGWLQGPWPSTVLRFGGIYGPGRNRLLDSVRHQSSTWPSVRHYTNRVHRDDCAGIIAHVLKYPRPAPVYLGVDHDPADKHAVLAFLHTQLHMPGAVPQAPPMQPATGKRCSSARLRDSGYAFAYPSYREGYAAMLSAQ